VKNDLKLAGTNFETKDDYDFNVVNANAPRCLPGLTFSDFDLALKRNEKFGYIYCGLDLVYSAGE